MLRDYLKILLSARILGSYWDLTTIEQQEITELTNLQKHQSEQSERCSIVSATHKQSYSFGRKLSRTKRVCMKLRVRYRRSYINNRRLTCYKYWTTWKNRTHKFTRDSIRAMQYRISYSQVTCFFCTTKKQYETHHNKVSTQV